MSKIMLSAFADEYSTDINEQITVLKENNIPYIEPRFINGKNVSDISAEEAKKVARLLSNNGIKAYSIGSPLGKVNLADNFDEHIERAKRTFDIANVLGAENIRIFSFYLRRGVGRKACRNEVVEKLAELLDLADEYGVTLCHENEAGIYGERADDCLELLDTFGGRLKCVFDMGNFVLDGEEPYPTAYEKLKGYIKYFHIKDSMSAGAIVPPGCGEARIADIISAYKRDFGGDFVLTLEPHLETFSGLNKLVGKKFDNPYKYADEKESFLDALARLADIINKIE